MKINLTRDTSPPAGRIQVRYKPSEWAQIQALRERSGHPDFAALVRAALEFYAEHAPECQDPPKK